jgi:hypothetical protein
MPGVFLNHPKHDGMTSWHYCSVYQMCRRENLIHPGDRAGTTKTMRIGWFFMLALKPV